MPREGTPNDSEVVENRDVQPFRLLNFINQGPHYYTGYAVPRRLFNDPKCMTLNDPE